MMAAGPPSGPLNRWMTAAMIIFPFLWFASVYGTLGYIPVLLTSDITQDIYELDYGPLYGWVLLIVVSMVVVVELLSSARTKGAKFLYGALLVFFGGCTMMDSKRVSLMIFMMALFAYLIRTRGARFMRPAAIAVVVVPTVLLYVGGQILRNGSDSEFFADGAVQLSTVGVEYRDFAYSVDNVEPGEIPDYNWALSTIGSMGNSTLLGAMGINKDELVKQGSAYAWKDFLGRDFGIRTGLVSELYFEYGYLGLFVVFAFGWLTAFVSAKVGKARTKYGLVFMCVVFGLLLLSIVGQSMGTTGSLTVLLYAWVLYLMLRRL
jgi:hypothetical protein